MNKSKRRARGYSVLTLLDRISQSHLADDHWLKVLSVRNTAGAIGLTLNLCLFRYSSCTASVAVREGSHSHQLEEKTSETGQE